MGWSPTYLMCCLKWKNYYKMPTNYKKIRESSQILGKNIERLRLSRDVTRKKLGRSINKNEQQIAKYEKGEFVPLPVIEAIGKALDEPVPKKIIRRISFVRKLEAEQNAEHDDELIKLYNEAMPDPYEEQ
jgi:transcriptional regulator with XRE-family HTH domain